jgi:hypothetical protein
VRSSSASRESPRDHGEIHSVTTDASRDSSVRHLRVEGDLEAVFDLGAGSLPAMRTRIIRLCRGWRRMSLPPDPPASELDGEARLEETITHRLQARARYATVFVRRAVR